MSASLAQRRRLLVHMYWHPLRFDSTPGGSEYTFHVNLLVHLAFDALLWHCIQSLLWCHLGWPQCILGSRQIFLEKRCAIDINFDSNLWCLLARITCNETYRKEDRHSNRETRIQRGSDKQTQIDIRTDRFKSSHWLTNSLNNQTDTGRQIWARWRKINALTPKK